MILILLFIHSFATFFILVEKKGGEPRVADFVHGSDGLGNLYLTSPKGNKIEKNAAEFLVDKVSEYPGEVSILALGPLTNIALVSFVLFSFSVLCKTNSVCSF